MTVERSADEAILESVFSSSRDRGADAAVPVVEESEAKAEVPVIEEPKALDAGDDKAKAPDDTAKPKGYRDPETGRFVPLEELKTEREKRQEAQKAREEEARLRVQAEENSRRYQAEIERLSRAVQERQNPPQPPPDPLMDPEGAFSHMQQTIEARLLNQSLNFSERMARKEHGNEAVTAAFQAAQQAGVAGQFVRAPDPYDAMVQWHKRQVNLQRVGDDVDAYEKRIREEERTRVMDEIRTGKASVVPGQAAPPQRLPGSLIDATASGPQGAQSISDEELAKNIFGHGRKRK